MYRFSTACVGLVCSFFSWHFIKFFPLQNIVSLFLKPGTIPASCERTAKVGENAEWERVIFEILLRMLIFFPLELQMS
jgi:hypothetical protein